MKRVLIFMLICLSCGAVSIANPYLDLADGLNRKGGVLNQKKAIEACLKAVEEDPSSYEANWKLSRAYAYYMHAAQEHLVDGWENACKGYGKAGMKYAQKAISLEPEKPDGHFFFAFNAGMYSFGVSILSAIAEGLKEKTQKCFEKVCQIDKNYEDGGAMASLGRFWHQLPWPLKDKKRAMTYYREYQKTPFYGKDPNTMVVIADLMADIGGEENRKEAKTILDAAMGSCGPYYLQIAQAVLKKID